MMCIIFVYSYIVAMCFICFDAEDHMLDKCVLNTLPSQNKDILLSLLLLPFKSPTALYKMSIVSISNC